MKAAKSKRKKKAKPVKAKTDNQKLGEAGERYVIKNCSCPRCKRERTLKQLIANFKCADVICDFCGFLGQVKAKRVADVSIVPKKLLGAAWDPQRQRVEAGLYFSLFIVLVDQKNTRRKAIYFLPSELQKPDMFIVRNPLSSSARRHGWQGFYYDLSILPEGAVIKVL